RGRGAQHARPARPRRRCRRDPAVARPPRGGAADSARADHDGRGAHRAREGLGRWPCLRSARLWPRGGVGRRPRRHRPLHRAAVMAAPAPPRRRRTMRVKDALVGNGRFLFRWRSLLPLLLLPVLALSLRESAQLNKMLGEDIETRWAWICFAVSLTGLAIRCYTVGYTPRGTSGRGTRHLRADMLNTTGIYSVVRNPLYLGNAIIALGLVMAIKVWWLAAIVVLAGFLYLERIIAAEEEFLAERFGAEYTRWVERTPAFIPRPSLWRPPDLP